MSENCSLFAMTPSQLCQILSLDKAFQGVQVYSWLVKGVSSFDQMTNLPKELRARLQEKYGSFWSSVIISEEKDSDGAKKLALQLYDGAIIECVLLTDKEGELTACLSSQVGCAMGCKFCRTGTLKLERNLEASEIVEQFMHLQNVAQGKIGHVVYMGMGEPFANLENVLTSISFLHDPKGLNISHRRITISTCGVVPGIIELSKRDVPVKLAVSLVVANDQKRNSLMPINRAYPLSQLRNALVGFQKVSGRRFTLEYCMIKGMNISEEDGDNLAHFAKNLEVIVNLIPFNPCKELPFETPSENEIRAFEKVLDKKGVEHTRRISRGRTIKGACGQLAGKLSQKEISK
ncbi:MAG: 23S rRNA (adenine(2503)-C(2))-methyltransferase RlmN [Sphaerochaetaceae bacterium]|nr:23S rRNA (adenine(2503)-C(2))-methyltransferase RlmN [Sphaerochaetaceae bacterium]